MTESQGMSRLEASLGYRFRNKALLETALTPPSTGLSPHNQRLEFLGDAILQCCVSELIYREKPEWDEGAMSKLRGMLVCTETLCDWAQSLDLVLGLGPRSTKQNPPAMAKKPRADAVEALIAAIYLDAGEAGLVAQDVVFTLVESRFLSVIQSAFIGIWQERDSKTTLQEWAAAASLPPPVYELINRGGPDHAPAFSVRVRVGDLDATATAGTLKGAQVEAARKVLKRLKPGK
jgi:ribonuclease III